MKLSVGGICRSFYWANDRSVRVRFMLVEVSHVITLGIPHHAMAFQPALLVVIRFQFGHRVICQSSNNTGKCLIWVTSVYLVVAVPIATNTNVGILGTRQEWRLLGYNFSTHENRADLIKVIFYEEMDRFLLKFSILKYVPIWQ